MEGKKNKGIIIILIVFILISVCLGGYIVVDKYTNKITVEIQLIQL